MDQIWALIAGKILWIVVGMSLGAGLVGAYGKERHNGRRPTKDWWFNRMYIMPVLAIIATFLIDLLHLNGPQASMLASMLALSGYEGLNHFEQRAKKRAGIAIDAALDGVVGQTEATAKDYFSMVQNDDANVPTAKVQHVQADHPRRSGVGAALREQLSPGTKEIPEDIRGLLKRLDDDNI